MPLGIIFMGTPEFAVPVLEGLVGADHELLSVYSQPPRPAGRGQSLRPSAIAQKAQDMGLPVCTPFSLKNPMVQDDIARAGADAIIVVAYGLILPTEVLKGPEHGCINVHASLLPRWRGAAPIQRAIMAGDEETGITIMQMDAGLDTGPILAQSTIEIGPLDTAGTLHDKLAALGTTCLLDCLQRVEKGRSVRTEQAGAPTYAKKIDKSEARIFWSLTAIEIDRKVRALSPWPGAWFSYNGKRIKIIEGKARPGSAPPGKTVDDALLIGCGEGYYQITKLQRPGKEAQDSATFLRGFPVPKGSLMDDIT